MKWFSINMPVPILFIMEVIVTRKFVKSKTVFTFSVLVGAALSGLIAMLWNLDPMDHNY
jgi:hypothetical protein